MVATPRTEPPRVAQIGYSLGTAALMLAFAAGIVLASHSLPDSVRLSSDGLLVRHVCYALAGLFVLLVPIALLPLLRAPRRDELASATWMAGQPFELFVPEPRRGAMQIWLELGVIQPRTDGQRYVLIDLDARSGSMPIYRDRVGVPCPIDFEAQSGLETLPNIMPAAVGAACRRIHSLAQSTPSRDARGVEVQEVRVTALLTEVSCDQPFVLRGMLHPGPDIVQARGRLFVT